MPSATMDATTEAIIGQDGEVWEPLKRLDRDTAQAAAELSQREARFLVDAYYTMQDDRKRSTQQARALDAAGEPNRVLAWFETGTGVLEANLKRALDKYSASTEYGRYLRSQVGIGPVIAAGILAHIDFHRPDPVDGTLLHTAGRIWRFAGLDPSVTWSTGEKRPWNTKLKTLTFHAGESFKKFSNHPKCYYGKLYQRRKGEEIVRNLSGQNGAWAAKVLREKNIGHDTEAYPFYAGAYAVTNEVTRALVQQQWEQGSVALKLYLADLLGEPGTGLAMLPPAHVDARARRWVVKLWLSHVFEVGFFLEHGQLPPAPYAMEKLGHYGRFYPPNLDSIPGMRQAYEARGEIVP